MHVPSPWVCFCFVNKFFCTFLFRICIQAISYCISLWLPSLSMTISRSIQLPGKKVGGKRWLKSLRLTCTRYYILSGWPTRTYWIAHGTLLNVMRQYGWNGNLEKYGRTYMHGWVPVLFTWNHHNIINQLYSNIN